MQRRNSERKTVKDCRVVLGDCVASQHRPLISMSMLTTDEKKIPQTNRLNIPKTQWWKLQQTRFGLGKVAEWTNRLRQRTNEGADDW